MRSRARPSGSKDAPPTEVVRADLEEPASLVAALAGCESAFYLAHSLGGDADFAERERRSALNFAEAAAEAGIGRIVYLGGLALR